MRVKIGNKVYDPNTEPIMLILSDADKAKIAGMPAENRRYCMYPLGMSESTIDAFMSTGFPKWHLEDGGARADLADGGTDADYNDDGTRKDASQIAAKP
jgi:hypothetical protein